MHITTSPYHPQSNGMVEKFNSTLKSMLNKTITTLFAYRTSHHHSTKVSPFYAMYLCDPVLPNQQEITPVNMDSVDKDIDMSSVLDKLKETKKDVEDKMQKNIAVAQARQKVAYDKRLSNF